MPRRIDVDERMLDCLFDAVDAGHTYKRMAADVGVCVDTLKRILHRHGIVEFEGAKYATSVEDLVVMWERPCNVCGNTTPRPKNQFRCDHCTEDYEHNTHIPDEWI